MIQVEYGGLRILDGQALTSHKIDELADALTAKRRPQRGSTPDQIGSIKLNPTV